MNLSIQQSSKRQVWNKDSDRKWAGKKRVYKRQADKAPPDCTAVDYQKVHVSGKKQCFILLQSIGIVAVSAYFLYRSALSMFILAPLGFWWFGEKQKEYRVKRQQGLRFQFREMLLSVAANLQAGYSVENAFREAGIEMTALYGKEADIVKELSILSNTMDNSIPIEQVLHDFGRRSGVEEIRDFAQIFRSGKRSGADMGDMIKHTVKLIGEKMETAREIQTVMSAKVMEQKVMSLVPLGIMGYIGLISPGFFEGLYHNVPGILFMSICLLLYVGAVSMARRIVRIEV